jgi:hypothetical protein
LTFRLTLLILLSTPSPHKRLRSGYTSMTRRPPCSNLTIGLEAFYHHLPLRLDLPQVLMMLMTLMTMK